MPDFNIDLPEEVIFRAPDLNNHGIFILHKSMFLVEGYNFPRAGRCDNLTYTGVSPTYGTPYQNEGIVIGQKSEYLDDRTDVKNGIAWIQFLDVAPLFCFTFTKSIQKTIEGRVNPFLEFEEGDYPGALWYGKSLIELFKNMREWSFMIEDPFNSDHPMAIYSKLVFDTLNPPTEILNEIDSLPDMHLARFLQGDPNHREKIDGFPQMSNVFKDWFKQKMIQYPKTTTRERLNSLTI